MKEVQVALLRGPTLVLHVLSFAGMHAHHYMCLCWSVLVQYALSCTGEGGCSLRDRHCVLSFAGMRAGHSVVGASAGRYLCNMH
jgi:hypothetical protein